MITVFGHPASTCTRKVLCTLHEIGQPFEFQHVDLARGEHQQPAHLARQPFGRVPAIDDDGFRLYESRAIIRYLNDRYGGTLVPADVRDRAAMDQWTSVEYAYFSAAAMTPVLHHVVGRPQDEAVLAAANTTIGQTLDVLEAHLGVVPYFAGAHFSLTDIVYLPYLDYLMATPQKAAVAERGNVMAWWSRCSQRPSWRKAAGR
ncbi:MAG TPA: glutathione S-transferase N-terminal domain-containing protein [Vineibacter sp.]|nr:glutathione S-transferase N-terminal domain-containing protein [Vineibacter sp.]